MGAFSSFFPPKWRKGLQPLAGDISVTTNPMTMIKPVVKIFSKGEFIFGKIKSIKRLEKNPSGTT